MTGRTALGWPSWWLGGKSCMPRAYQSPPSPRLSQPNPQPALGHPPPPRPLNSPQLGVLLGLHGVNLQLRKGRLIGLRRRQSPGLLPQPSRLRLHRHVPLQLLRPLIPRCSKPPGYGHSILGQTTLILLNPGVPWLQRHLLLTMPKGTHAAFTRRGATPFCHVLTVTRLSTQRQDVRR